MPRALRAVKGEQARAVVLFVVAYVLSVWLSERAYGLLSVPSPFWLPDSILLSALLLAPRAYGWMFLVCMWPIRLFMGAPPGTPLWFQIVSIVNDTLKAIAAAWVVRRLRADRIRTLREFLTFLGVAATAVPPLSALAAVPPLRAAFGEPRLNAAFQWFIGDALAQTIVTPTILFWSAFRNNDGRWREMLLVLTLLTASSVYTFVFSDYLPPMGVYAPVPFLIWAALRLRPIGAASAVTSVAIISMIGAAQGIGPFADDAMHHSVLSMQLFLVITAVPLLSLAILIHEREVLRLREAAVHRQLLLVQDRERARIAQELHDDIGQRLALLQVGLDRFRSTADGLSADVDRQVAEWAEAAVQIASGIHELSHELHPGALDIVGLDKAIHALCRNVSREYSVEVRYTSSQVPEHADPVVSLCLFRITQEALHNVVKHSGATVAEVALDHVEDGLVLSISDTGKGFDGNDVAESKGLGLNGMRERLRAVGGRLSIRTAPNAGTRIRIEVPVGVRPLGEGLPEFDI